MDPITLFTAVLGLNAAAIVGAAWRIGSTLAGLDTGLQHLASDLEEARTDRGNLWSHVRRNRELVLRSGLAGNTPPFESSGK